MSCAVNIKLSLYCLVLTTLDDGGGGAGAGGGGGGGDFACMCVCVSGVCVCVMQEEDVQCPSLLLTTLLP